ncbi:MAG: hypothetical protein JSR15_08790, partial [Proteobacteria bacterium]|nr:hypothetical protein [Pseudomonadota bacterium]
NAGIAMALALLGKFAALAVWSTLAIAPLYALGCAAAWRLARRGVAQAGAPLNFRWLGTAAAIGIAGTLALVALAERAEIIGLLATIVASALGYLLVARQASPGSDTGAAGQGGRLE